MEEFKTIFYAGTMVSLLTLVIFELSNVVSSFKTFAVFYPFDDLYHSLRKYLPLPIVYLVVTFVVFITMIVLAGQKNPFTMLLMYFVFAIAVAVDFWVKKNDLSKLATAAYIVAMVAWFFVPSWMTFNIVAMAVSAYLIATFSFKDMKTFAIVTGIMMLFDAAIVYGTNIGANTIAQTFLPPVFLLVPKDLTYPSMLMQDMRAVLGMTDILVTGVAYKMVKERGTNGNIMKVATVLSIFLVFAVSKLVGISQPALVLIVPLMWGAMYMELNIVKEYQT